MVNYEGYFVVEKLVSNVGMKAIQVLCKGLLKTAVTLLKENIPEDCPVSQLRRLSVDNNCPCLEDLALSFIFDSGKVNILLTGFVIF